MTIPTNYSNNVFINCPFDTDYLPIFRAIVFTIHDCGFIPRCALEEDTATENRLSKIMRIIDECKFGIHDISKADLDHNIRLARFNMPMELGLFLGAQKFSASKHYNKDKKALVMDVEKFRYRNFISDISGQDIKEHGFNPLAAVGNVRDFLFNNTRRTSIASPNFYKERYSQFSSELPVYCEQLRWDIDSLNFLDFSAVAEQWIIQNK